ASSASTNGARVVLPAPGGATSTAVLPARSAAVSSGNAASIGNGGKFIVGNYPLHRANSRESPILSLIMPTAQKAAPKAPKPQPASAAAPAAAALKKGDHVFLVDGSGYIFRAYHALPP